jgi:NADH-quinone oxidoreductase subunit C
MEEAADKKLSVAVEQARNAYALIKERFGDAVSDFDANETMPFFEVLDTDLWPDIAYFMRETPRLKFNYMACLSGVDYLEEGKLGIVCNLENVGPLSHRIAVKLKCDRNGGTLPSVACVWLTSDWHEREAYDMYGIVFTGHPDMRRILCPDDWTGYPLRKDYQVQETYHGIKVPY